MKNLLFTLLFFFISLSVYSQNIDYSNWIYQFSSWETSCNQEWGDEEYTRKGWLWDNLHPSQRYSGCQECDNNGDCHSTGTWSNGTWTNTSKPSTFNMRIDAWEDDNGSRCSFYTNWNVNNDDCRTNTSDSFSLGTPVEYQNTTQNNSVGDNDHRAYVRTTYKYHTVSIPAAVDNSSVNYTTGGNRPFWGSTGSWASVGGDCATSGTITHIQTSSFSTTVYHKSSISFKWKVSSEANYDYLIFYINGIEQAGKISGVQAWATKTFVLDPCLNNVLEWRYTKDGSVSSNLDRGFVDNISFVDYTAAGNPTSFGSNEWNVYGYNQRNGYNVNDNLNLSNLYYEGFYTDNNIDITSTDRWASGASPSSATGWSGCNVNINNHVVVYKRQGFPCGHYEIDLDTHDDAVRCYVNGIQVVQFSGCCTDRGVVYDGYLNANSTVEFRVTEGGGGSNLQVDFDRVDNWAPVASISNAPVCSGSTVTLTASGLAPGGGNNGVGVFNNSSSINLGDPAPLNITGNQTIEMWVKPSNFGSRRNPYAKAYGGEGTITIETNRKISYYYGQGGGNNGPYQGFNTGKAVLNTNIWTHVALVRDLSNLKLYWYIDGQLVNSVVANFTTATASNLNAIIGDGYTNNFEGNIDNVRIWNVARTNEQIADNMYLETPVSSTGLVAHYNLNNNTNDIAGSNNGANSGITFTAQDYYTYTWSGTAAPSASINEIQTTSSLLSNSSYTVVASPGSGCVNSNLSNSLNMVVEIPPTPPTSITGTSTICNGSSTTLTVNGGSNGSGATYQWYLGGCGSGSIIGTGNTITVSPTSNETYYVRRKGNTSCSNTTTCANQLVTVKQVPTATAGGSTTICPASSATVSGASSANGTILWTHNGLGSLTNATTLTPTYTPVAGDAGNTVILTMTVSNAPCTPATATFTVNIQTESTATTSATTSSSFVCSDSNITLTAIGGSLGTGATWQWYSDASFTTSVGSGSPLTITVTATNSYYVRAEGTCNNTSSQNTGLIVVNGSVTAPSASSTLATTTSSSTCVVNNGVWHHFYNSSGELLAAINSNGENLGSVTVSIEVNNMGPYGTGLAPGVCGYTGVNNGEYALPRNWDISVTTQPTNPVDVIFYYKNSDVSALTSQIAGLAYNTDYVSCWGDVASESDLMMTVDHSGSLELFPSLTFAAGPNTGAGQRQIAFQLSQFSQGFLHSNGGLTGAGNALPVELITFDAKAIDNEFISIDWQTATEINNNGFELQRSTDGIFFNKIAWIEGNGNSNKLNSYQYKDNDVSVGTYYYRLKQIDFDGQFEFSDIQSASIRSTGGDLVSFFIPNPSTVKSKLNFNLVKDSKVTIEVIDNIGRVIESKTENMLSGNNTVLFNTDNYATGIYTAKIIIGNNEFTRKLVVR